jgi:cytochrome c oxidase assembly protein subunit 15
MRTPAYDFSPSLALLLLGAALALLPLLWVGWRHRRASPGERWRALAWVAMFLTFDLVLVGAFTRLTDSGLGCPDWPGCYGNASPFGAHHEINAAQSAMPTGPVTHGKAWIEMLHRYLATGVGGLITVLAIAAWVQSRRQRLMVSPWWATATWIWVCLQGAFGALTVTMKLYPAIVTAHLLGALGLLGLLAVQSQLSVDRRLGLSPALLRGAMVVLAVCVLQIALGGWVSTNYAVLACREFPTCQGEWWPAMDFARGFTVVRELGMGPDGEYLPFSALTAIHVAHRLGAAVVLVAVGGLAWRLWISGDAEQRRWAQALGVVLLWQLVTGLSNVVLDWPLVAAVGHTGGAAALVVVLTMMITRARRSDPTSGAPAATPTTPRVARAAS